MFKRKIYQDLLQWKKMDGKYAALIEGARRIGKTTIVQEFANKEYKSNIFIDFQNASKEIIELFDDYSDLNFFFLRLQQAFKTRLYERESVIVFDEVQLCPRARQAIKSLVNDGRYDYIETGSLISIQRNVQGIIIPSEEHKIQMNPMDFEEFLLAIGDTTTYDLMKESFFKFHKFGDSSTRDLLKRFRLYMLIGGMPQAVEEYLKSNNFVSVDFVKRKILELYDGDFRKLDQTGDLSKLFKSIPSQLNSGSSRFSAGKTISRTTKMRLSSLISQLEDSKTVIMSYRVNDPNVGLSFMYDQNNYKLFMADTGLFITQMFWDKDISENIIYEKLFYDRLSVNLGYLYENIVAQMLTAKGDKLFYYAQRDEIAHKNYEVDFLVSRKNKICPIEVKSSSYKSHKSLDIFIEKFSNRVDTAYLAYLRDLKKTENITYIPVFAVDFI